MIRVLHIIDSMDRGGIQTTLMNIYRSIDREKVLFDFLVQTNKKCHYDDEIKKLGGKIYRITPRKNSVYKNTKELDNFFKCHKEYKIVHMHVSSLTYIKPLQIAKKHNVPIRIIHSRNTRNGGNALIHTTLHYLNKNRIQKIANYYFSCSDEAGKWLYTNKIIKSNRYKIINNGILTEKFKFNLSERKAIRQKYNCNNKLAIVNVARLHPQKNQMFLIDIFKEIKNKRQDSVMFIVGEGALKNDLERKINEEKLNDSVFLTGNIPNVNEILQGMDIFLLPSLYEGLPGSVIEAQGSALPCYISDTITKSVKITKLVHFIGLDKTASEWANIILNTYNEEKRVDTSNIIKDAGFDMETVSEQLQSFYQRAINED